MNANVTFQENYDLTASNVLQFIAKELNANYDVFAINLFSFNKKFFENIGEDCGRFYAISFPAMVPEAGTLPSYQNIYFALTGPSWIYVGASIVFLTLVQKLLQFFYRKTANMPEAVEQKELPLWQNFLLTIQAFFGDSLTKFPQTGPGRLILLGWIFYSFLVTSSFTAKLLSSLISPRNAENIDTLDQLFKSNVRMNVLREIKRHFEDYVREDIRQKLFKRVNFISYSNLSTEIRSNYLNRRNGFLMADYVIDKYVLQYYDKVNQKPYFHKMSESFMDFPGVYFLQRGSPHLERVNQLLGMFHQFGFFVCWEELAVFSDTLDGAYGSEDIDEGSSEVTLRADHLQTIFYVWSIGMFCAIFSFLGEIMLTFYRKKKSEREQQERNTSSSIVEVTILKK